MWAAAKVALLAAWALVMGYFLAAMVERFEPNTFVAPDGFAAAVAGLALGIFICLVIAFRNVAELDGNATELPQPAATLSVTCPTCHDAMTLQGEYPDRPLNVYIWTCERSHWWRRVGVNAVDATFPWRVLSAAPNGDSASPKVHFD